MGSRPRMEPGTSWIHVRAGDNFCVAIRTISSPVRRTGHYFIWQLALILPSALFEWQQAAQRSLIFHFTMSRGPRVLVQCFQSILVIYIYKLESSWNVMAHGDARKGKCLANWRMEWVASTLHTTSENGVSSFTTADGHTSAASSQLNWRPTAI